MSVAAFYDRLWEVRDKRVDDWPLMASPWPTVTLCAAYVYCVTALGPTLMRDRQPFQLKNTILVYNLVQVLMSAYLVYEGLAAGWATRYSWVCQDVERSSEPGSPGMRMAAVAYFYYLCKFTEFFDTVCFIARKKFAHVSMLQVIHHGIMPIFSWSITRWVPGGHETMGGILNSFIHVIMYAYYFMAALGPEFQKYLWWKRYLTTMQMVQFAVVFAHSMIVVAGVAECGFPWQFSAFTSGLVALFFVLFTNFYIQEYIKKRNRAKAEKQE